MLFYDGINSEGLIGNVQVLTEAGTNTTEAIEQAGKHALLQEEVVAFFLSQFKTVAEIKVVINDYAITDALFPAWPSAGLGLEKMRFPFHFTFADKTGAGLVLEPAEDGSINAFDSVRVTDNSHRYDWHLRNSLQINDHNSTPITLKSG